MKERDQYCVKTALLTTFLLALVSLVISVLAFNDTKNLKSTFDRNKLEANGSNSYGTTSTSATNTSSITIDEILRRGFLRCGVPSEQPGFAITSLTENQTGFDADMCRAVAAAVFGKSAGHIEFIPIISGSERWTALRDRKIDVLSLVTTNTMERDVYEVRVVLKRCGMLQLTMMKMNFVMYFISGYCIHIVIPNIDCLCPFQ